MDDEQKKSDAPVAAADEAGQGGAPRARPPIKIGSQRQATGVIRAKPQTMVVRPQTPPTIAEPAAPTAQPPAQDATAAPTASAAPDAPTTETGATPSTAALPTVARLPLPRPAPPPTTAEVTMVPPPKIRDVMREEVQDEIDAAMGGVSLEDMMSSPARMAGPELEPESLQRGKVLSVRGRDVFVDLGGRNQGTVPLAQFAVPPEPGVQIEVSVKRFDPAEGLYDLSVPDAAVSVAGWSELSEGLVVDAVVTGHNQGGLEVEVNRIRGFIPISQVALFRVESLAEYVGQRLACVVIEVHADSRKLVLSHRAMLERQRADARDSLIKSIEVGQDREGVVTRLQPFGAFVDLGGIDGLIHVSQLSWERVAHPSEVLEVGQRVKVRVTKVDPETGKIGLAYRESWDNPWESAARKYPSRSKVEGTVSKLTDFGAFVRLEPGIEGLIHISELDHRRVFRAGDVVQEGQKVDVLVLSVDAEQQRISLSLKALQARPELARKAAEEEAEESVPASSLAQSKNQGPLKGGVDRPSGGAQFGLKW